MRGALKSVVLGAVVGGGSFLCAVVVGVFVTIMTYGLFDWTEAYYFTASRRHLLAHLGFALSMAVTLTTLFGLPLLVSHRLRIHPAFSLVVAGALAGLAAGLRAVAVARCSTTAPCMYSFAV